MSFVGLTGFEPASPWQVKALGLVFAECLRKPADSLVFSGNRAVWLQMYAVASSRSRSFLMGKGWAFDRFWQHQSLHDVPPRLPHVIKHGSLALGPRSALHHDGNATASNLGVDEKTVPSCDRSPDSREQALPPPQPSRLESRTAGLKHCVLRADPHHACTRISDRFQGCQELAHSQEATSDSSSPVNNARNRTGKSCPPPNSGAPAKWLSDGRGPGILPISFDDVRNVCALTMPGSWR